MDNEMRDQAEMAEKIGIAVSRRKAFAMAAKLGLGSAALAGGLGTGLAANPPEAAGGLPKKNYKFVFVNHVTTNEFFTPTIYGIQDACAFFGCSYQWTGSQNSVVSEMVNAMQTAIAGKADGIAVCLDRPQGVRRADGQCARRRHPGDRLQRRCAGRQPQQAPVLCRATALPVRLQHCHQMAEVGAQRAATSCSRSPVRAR